MAPLGPASPYFAFLPFFFGRHLPSSPFFAGAASSAPISSAPSSPISSSSSSSSMAQFYLFAAGDGEPAILASELFVLLSQVHARSESGL